MTEWISQEVLLKRLDITPKKLGFLLEENALPRARWNGERTLWNWDEVRESKFVLNPAYRHQVLSPITLIGLNRIYFIEINEFIKIGYTGSVFSRLQQIQCESPYEITLLHSTPGGRAQEAYIHRIFAADRVRGEWFRKTPRLLALIESFKDQDAGTDEVQPKGLASF